MATTLVARDSLAVFGKLYDASNEQYVTDAKVSVYINGCKPYPFSNEPNFIDSNGNFLFYLQRSAIDSATFVTVSMDAGYAVYDHDFKMPAKQVYINDTLRLKRPWQEACNPWYNTMHKEFFYRLMNDSIYTLLKALRSRSCTTLKQPQAGAAPLDSITIEGHVTAFYGGQAIEGTRITLTTGHFTEVLRPQHTDKNGKFSFKVSASIAVNNAFKLILHGNVNARDFVYYGYDLPVIPLTNQNLQIKLLERQLYMAIAPDMPYAKRLITYDEATTRAGFNRILLAPENLQLKEITISGKVLYWGYSNTYTGKQRPIHVIAYNTLNAGWNNVFETESDSAGNYSFKIPYSYYNSTRHLNIKYYVWRDANYTVNDIPYNNQQIDITVPELTRAYYDVPFKRDALKPADPLKDTITITGHIRSNWYTDANNVTIAVIDKEGKGIEGLSVQSDQYGNYTLLIARKKLKKNALINLRFTESLADKVLVKDIPFNNQFINVDMAEDGY